MNSEELAAMWESYLHLTPGTLAGKAPPQPAPAPLSGLSGWNTEIYNEIGDVVAHVQAIPKTTFPGTSNKAITKAPVPAPVPTLGNGVRRIIR